MELSDTRNSKLSVGLKLEIPYPNSEHAQYFEEIKKYV